MKRMVWGSRIAFLCLVALLLSGIVPTTGQARDLNVGALKSRMEDLTKDSTEGGKAAELASLTGGSEEILIGVVLEGTVATELDDQGLPVGYDVDVVAAVLKTAKYKEYRFVVVPMDQAHEYLAAGKVNYLLGVDAQADEIATRPYLADRGELVRTNGQTIDWTGKTACLVSMPDQKSVIAAFDANFDKTDISGALDAAYEKAFETGVFFNVYHAVRRWFKSIARQFTLNLIEGERYMMLVNGLKQTILIAFCAAALGILLGCAVALMRLSNLRLGRWYFMRGISTLYVNIIRGTPVVVQLMVIYYVVLASVDISKTMVAIIAFALNSAAYVSEMVRGGILAVDKGQTEAGRSLGLSSSATMLLIVLPQTIKIIIPSLFNEIVMLLKETSVVGFIGLMDLTKGGDYIRSRTYSAFFPLLTVAAVYLIIVTLCTRFFNMIERRIRQSDLR